MLLIKKLMILLLLLIIFFILNNKEINEDYYVQMFVRFLQKCMTLAGELGRSVLQED